LKLHAVDVVTAVGLAKVGIVVAICVVSVVAEVAVAVVVVWMLQLV